MESDNQYTSIFLTPEDSKIPSDLILSFNRSRQIFEKRLKKLGPEKIKELIPVVNWMRSFLKQVAPELLVDPLNNNNSE